MLSGHASSIKLQAQVTYFDRPMMDGISNIMQLTTYVRRYDSRPDEVFTNSRASSVDDRENRREVPSVLKKGRIRELERCGHVRLNGCCAAILLCLMDTSSPKRFLSSIFPFCQEKYIQSSRTFRCLCHVLRGPANLEELS